MILQGLYTLTQLLVVSGIVGILGAITGGVLAKNAGKPVFRGILAGAVLGAGVGIGLSNGTLPSAFIAGIATALTVWILGQVYQRIVDATFSDDEINFDVFEAFSWAVFDGSLNPVNLGSGELGGGTLKSLLVNLGQAFAGFIISRDDLSTRIDDFARNFIFAMNAAGANLIFEMISGKGWIKLPPWVMRAQSSRLGLVLNHWDEVATLSYGKLTQLLQGLTDMFRGPEPMRED